MFDFFQALISGIITFAISSVLGSAFILLLRANLQDRIEQWLQGIISEYIREQLRYTIEHPNETAKTFAPIITAILKEALKDFEKANKPQTVNLFGLKIPSEVLQLLMSKFLGNNSRKETSNPFA